ncbi:winged helix DNA-binding domain-containing protein [Streptomyces sp. NPDC014861]|uniref:winged helix DNA-binding domain-containing protein n=1 Tax=Streptomyces sp. NPDC014861 TaxID=3364923 RepID=UPI0036F75D2E
MKDRAAEVPVLPWAGVSARRLERSSLMPTGTATDPADVVTRLCGAHAQVLSAAELSVGLRLSGTTRVGVREALWTERTLVKTYGPRGTVHLLPTRDLPMWTGALSALPPSSGNARGGQQLLTPDQIDQVVAAVADSLEDAELTADELTEAIVERTGSWAGDPVMEAFQGKWPRWRAAMDLAANRGALCFGPTRGRKVTYTNPHRWLPGFTPQEGPAALAALVTSYLHAFGPATPQHFARWLAAPNRWATELFASLGDALEEVELAGERAWVVAGDTAVPDAPPRGLVLLPYFDAYVVGCRPRDLLYPGAAAERALAAGQAGNFPVLLVDGQVAGVWHQRRSGRKLHVTVEEITPLTGVLRKELDAQVARVGEILEGRTELTLGRVTVGPHA